MQWLNALMSGLITHQRSELKNKKYMNEENKWTIIYIIIGILSTLLVATLGVAFLKVIEIINALI